MAKIVLAGAVAALLLPLMSMQVQAGPIERACLRSDRANGDRGLCACIQQVADRTLKGGDQRKAAQLLNNPDKAHDVWISKRASDDAFWEHYKAFGQAAEAYCGG